MAKSTFPIILLGGGLALLLSGGKKKSKKKKSSDTVQDDFVEPDGFDEDFYVPPTAPPKPAPSDPSRPSGNPPRGDSYDGSYWGDALEDQLTSIRQHFANLDYDVNVGPWPMNKLGPKGTLEIVNEDGSVGKLGGDDDSPSETVRKFQKEYNTVSRLNKADKIYSQNMGGLATDGLVGPYTLNALRYANEGLPGGKMWTDILMTARNKGIV